MEWIGWFAVICSSVQLYPEITKALMTHHLRDVSWLMLGIIFVGSIAWAAYGFIIISLQVTLAAILNGCAAGMLLFLKTRYD